MLAAGTRTFWLFYWRAQRADPSGAAGLEPRKKYGGDIGGPSGAAGLEPRGISGGGDFVVPRMSPFLLFFAVWGRNGLPVLDFWDLVGI